MASSQVPTTQGRPLSAIQQRAQQVERAREHMLADVEAHRTDLEQFLRPLQVDYEFFVAGLRVFLMRQVRENPDFFLKLTDTNSFLEALLRIGMNGLIPDGKEAAIAVYAGVAQAMFMRDGFVKVLWRTGMIKAINDQVVTVAEYETGRFEYEEGDDGFIRHKMDLMRKDTDPVIAAYCKIDFINGGVMREVVPKDELDKIAKMSKSPARKEWQHESHRKAAIRRIMKKMPREKGIVQLLQHDDETYDSKLLTAPAGAEGGEAPDHKALFGNRPIRRKRPPLEVEAREEPPAEDLAADEPLPDEDGDAHEEPQDDEPANEEPEFILHALLTAKNGVQQFASGQAEFWYGDIQQRMKALKDDAAILAAFWDKNRGYIVEAGQNGHADYAMKLMTLGVELGCEKRDGDRG